MVEVWSVEGKDEQVILRGHDLSKGCMAGSPCSWKLEHMEVPSILEVLLIELFNPSYLSNLLKGSKYTRPASADIRSRKAGHRRPTT